MGRLSSFEDSDEIDVPSISLPPRRTRRDVPTAEPTDQPPRATPLPSAQAPASAVAPSKPVTAPAPRAKPAQAPVEAADRAETGAKGPEDRVRASNVHIPVALLEPVTSACQAKGLSHGELIIIAIESSYSRLKELINPAATAGGQLFAERRGRASRAPQGPLTPLNYRLRNADFATLDALVDEFGATSRGQLITAALTDYLRSDRSL